jgi:hypothetical protein
VSKLGKRTLFSSQPEIPDALWGLIAHCEQCIREDRPSFDVIAKWS